MYLLRVDDHQKRRTREIVVGKFGVVNLIKRKVLNRLSEAQATQNKNTAAIPIQNHRAAG